MNYLSLIIIIAALVLSWNSPNMAPELSLHTQIQHKVSDLIIDAATKHRKTVDEVKIDKIWTQKKDDSKIEIRFEYSFLSGKSIVEEVEGHALAKRQKDKSWLVQSVTLDQQTLKF